MPEKLRYESALPMSNGRLAMLLFLSTEVMFFTAILGAYIVLRFPLWDVWPTQSQVHVELWIGIVNTVILLASCVSLWLAKRKAAADDAGSAKRLLLVTVALAAAFLGFKGYEYITKFEHGLYPSAKTTLIHDQADQLYLSQTVAEFNKIAGEREANIQSEQDEERLEKLNLIRSGVVQWTQQKVGIVADPEIRQSAIDAMAYQVLPDSRRPLDDKYLAAEAREVEYAASGLQTQLENTEADLKASQMRLRELTPEKEASADSRDAFAEESKLAEDLTEKIGDIRKEMVPLKNRLRAVDELGQSQRGINATYGVNLPFVLPGGKAWVNTYYLLTGFHLLHLIVGLGVLLYWLFLRIDKSRLHWLQNFGLYWHFVDLVWLVIFVIVYLT